MDILISHIGYIIGTLFLGILIGWKTAPHLSTVAEKLFNKKEVE